ncbi:MAG: RecQ family ATP-dependent DNA helicase [Flavobacterium sp.]
MIEKAKNVLLQYWGYSNFRTLQEEIITSVLEGKDTFALMPTSGGKSICYQVPAMVNDGICLVISPLIALIKDQVSQLQKRNIKAIAMVGSLKPDEVSDLLDNCIYGNYKFLYISPERLSQEWILDRIVQLPLNLIAIDEAHCVSQWGHDFRPNYLKINVLKKYFSKTPFIAVTATATKRVLEDVIASLQLEKPNIFRKSFLRENLAFRVIKTEDKVYMIQTILSNNLASSIIYVRNRNTTIEWCNILEKIGFTATYYHGGLTMEEKNNHMNLWMSNQKMVMVATNAFGMGIDKPDVRNVIHIQIPESLENYYQEAGRAGRDGKMSYSYLLYHESDILSTKNIQKIYTVDQEYLLLIYKKLNNFFQIAYGEGYNETYPFDIQKFCGIYQLPIPKTYNAIQFLDRQGILNFEIENIDKILIQFIAENKEIIRYISKNNNLEELITTILRKYPGIYEKPIPINIHFLVKEVKLSEIEILNIFKVLLQNQIITYINHATDSKITFLEIREDERTINKVTKYLNFYNHQKQIQQENVLNYIKDEEICKSKFIATYFDEKNLKNCEICSICLKKKDLEKVKILDYESYVLKILEEIPKSSRDLQLELKLDTEMIKKIIKKLLEDEKIILTNDFTYKLIKR